LPEKAETVWAASVNWRPFDDGRTRAAAAAEKGEYADAIRQYCGVIRYIMKQFREHRPTVDTNSHEF
jgi:hypothetical protein